LNRNLWNTQKVIIFTSGSTTWNGSSSIASIREQNISLFIILKPTISSAKKTYKRNHQQNESTDYKNHIPVMLSTKASSFNPKKASKPNFLSDPVFLNIQTKHQTLKNKDQNNSNCQHKKKSQNISITHLQKLPLLLPRKYQNWRFYLPHFFLTSKNNIKHEKTRYKTKKHIENERKKWRVIIGWLKLNQERLTSTVGFPRLSKIWRALTALIVTIVDLMFQHFDDPEVSLFCSFSWDSHRDAETRA